MNVICIGGLKGHRKYILTPIFTTYTQCRPHCQCQYWVYNKEIHKGLQVEDVNDKTKESNHFIKAYLIQVLHNDDADFHVPINQTNIIMTGKKVMKTNFKEEKKRNKNRM